MRRYERNKTAISEQEQEILHNSKVLVVGCGGLGGYSIEFLGRLGVGYITAVDCDVFDESNLNRQILSSSSTMGKPKAAIAKERMKDVNPLVHIESKLIKLSADNAPELVTGHSVIIDALDNITSRRKLLNAANSEGIPYVHGAIVGWRGRVTVSMPGDMLLSTMFENTDDSVKPRDGNLGFTAALVAAVQSSEAVKLIIGRGKISDKRILEFDLLGGSFDSIDVGV